MSDLDLFAPEPLPSAPLPPAGLEPGAPNRPAHGSLTHDFLGKTFVGQEADSATNLRTDEVFADAVVPGGRLRVRVLAGTALLIAGTVALAL